ncbi:MAG: ATP-binding cassette domain-containing protein [Desulfosporosinus sp.]|nr:ATP-binding cassette domain-containing protein [Desulfosporosinus sp.]
MNQSLIQLKGIVKKFPGVLANDHVDLDINPGEIHAILGENGSGKSTLMSVLAGLYKPDAGKILLNGVEQKFRSPRDAIACGIGMVHQHFKLVEPFTVAENITLGEKGNSFF